MQVCRLIEAQGKVTFLRTSIRANEATDCTYFQWRAEAIVGVPMLQDCWIDMHITLMYMHVEPRWQEVLAGMQEQWQNLTRARGAGLSAPINHTESDWILSEYSDESRGMLKLRVDSRLYQALQQTVVAGTQKLPAPSRPHQWRFRNEYHLSVLPSVRTG